MSDHEVSWKPYHDGRGGGWQAGYLDHYGRGTTRREALAALETALSADGITPPRPAPEPGSVRVAIVANVKPGTFPEGHFWAAEFDTFQATAPTPEAAVEALRGAMRAEGREAPIRVYDVAKTIAGWMN